jgi:mono/diheme cytochrome c family protein/sugar lactone lactonase YvrE
MWLRRGSMLAALVLFACGPRHEGVQPLRGQTDGADGDVFAPGAAAAANRSGVMIHSPRAGELFVADADNGAVLRLGEGTAESLEVGEEPTRLVRFEDHIWGTLRKSGKLVEVFDDGQALRVVRVVDVGAEPFDVVVSPDGARLYVSLSQQEEVIRLETSTLEVTGRYRVEGEPRWLAVAADAWSDDELLLVLPFRGARLVRLNPVTEEQRAYPFPDARIVDRAGCEDQLLVPRATGEMVWDPLEDTVWVLGTYANTVMPASPAGVLREDDGCAPGGPPSSGAIDAGSPSSPPDAPTIVDRPAAYYGTPSVSPSIGRFNPVLLRFDLVTETPAVVWTLTAPSPGASLPNGLQPLVRGTPVTLDLMRDGGPSDLVVFVGIESDESVVVVDPYEAADRLVDFYVPSMSAILATGGASGMRSSGEEWGMPYVWSQNRRAIDQDGHDPLLAPPSELPTEVLRGRELFTLSSDVRMVETGGGVACASCHVEGRTDGLTWRFPDMDRQTPSLAGGVSETAPFTWTADVPSVAEEAKQTASMRMGGTGIDDLMASRITAFVDWTRPVALPAPTADQQELLVLGREVFRRPEVGCATCHSDAAGASAGVHAMHGLERVGVPALRGIAATAPYFHDGSAATLRDVLERSRDGSMGDTSSLTEREMAALEAWLRHFGQAALP